MVVSTNIWYAPVNYSLPVMKVTRNPNFRTIHPDIVSGQTKYAPKYAACRPLDLLAVILRLRWKWEFKTSSNPYAKPHRKKRMVTR